MYPSWSVLKILSCPDPIASEELYDLYLKIRSWFGVPKLQGNRSASALSQGACKDSVTWNPRSTIEWSTIPCANRCEVACKKGVSDLYSVRVTVSVHWWHWSWLNSVYLSLVRAACAWSHIADSPSASAQLAPLWLLLTGTSSAEKIHSKPWGFWYSWVLNISLYQWLWALYDGVLFLLGQCPFS